MSEILRPPQFCPKCTSRSIAPTGEEKILTSPSLVRYDKRGSNNRTGTDPMVG
jgi:hypothetical protein